MNVTVIEQDSDEIIAVQVSDRVSVVVLNDTSKSHDDRRQRNGDGKVFVRTIGFVKVLAETKVGRCTS